MILIEYLSEILYHYLLSMGKHSMNKLYHRLMTAIKEGEEKRVVVYNEKIGGMVGRHQ